MGDLLCFPKPSGLRTRLLISVVIYLLIILNFLLHIPAPSDLGNTGQGSTSSYSSYSCFSGLLQPELTWWPGHQQPWWPQQASSLLIGTQVTGKAQRQQSRRNSVTRYFYIIKFAEKPEPSTWEAQFCRLQASSPWDTHSTVSTRPTATIPLCRNKTVGSVCFSPSERAGRVKHCWGRRG